jgi:hypothetical protein
LKIYVAGPYTRGSESLNIAKAVEGANALWDKGHTPFIPHMSHFWEMIGPRRHYEEWMKWCLVWVEACDALLRMPGESSGADREVELALKLGKPVYYSLDEVGSAD